MDLSLPYLESNHQTNENNFQVPLIRHQAKIDWEIRHAIPGRIRLNIPKLAGDTQSILGDCTYGEKLTYALKSLPWVEGVRINPAASCAIINYQSHLGSDSQQQIAILAIVQQADTLALLPTATREVLETEFGNSWNWLSGDWQNFFAGFEGVEKEILRAIGIANLIVGIAGLILPLIPGIPFLFLSHLCFLACS